VALSGEKKKETGPLWAPKVWWNEGEIWLFYSVGVEFVEGTLNVGGEESAVPLIGEYVTFGLTLLLNTG
jgi:hypothetical protein